MSLRGFYGSDVFSCRGFAYDILFPSPLTPEDGVVPVFFCLPYLCRHNLHLFILRIK
jgi:hypothetical protein